MSRDRLRASCLTAVVILLLVNPLHALFVNYISPRHGSLAGGQRVTIFGSGFSPDQYAGGTVIFFGNVQCDVDWFTVTPTRVVCVTRPYPTAKRGDRLDREPLTVFSGGHTYTTRLSRQWWKELRYDWNYTPRLNQAVVPTSTATNTLIRIRGRLYGYSSYLQRVMVGTRACDLRKQDSSDYYYYSHSRVDCVLEETLPGNYNVSLSAPNFGNSWNTSEALRVSASGQLHIFQLFAEIFSVSPRVGSDEGGTVLSIEGSGFGQTAERVSVEVGGVPCQVINVSNTLIKCITAKPPADSPVWSAGKEVLAGNWTKIPLFRGNRGTSRRTYHGISSTYISSLLASPKFPNDPDEYSHTNDFDSPRNIRGSYGQMMEAYFHAPFSGFYTFFIATDDGGSLLFSKSTDSNQAEEICSIYGYTSRFHSSWASWFRYPEQRSKPIYLEEGEFYYMRGLMQEHGGADHLQVAFLLHNTSLTPQHTSQSLSEKHSITIQATHQKEVQRINITAEHSDTQMFQVTVDGRETSPLPVVNLTQQDVETQLHELMSSSCYIEPGLVDFDFFDLDTFESGPGGVDQWIGHNNDQSTQPNIVIGDSYCGFYALKIINGETYNFRGDQGLEAAFEQANGWASSDFPYVCTAFRIPLNVSVAMVISVVHGETTSLFSIPMTGTPQLSGGYTQLSEPWLDGGLPLLADNVWHYSCYDLDRALSLQLGGGQRYLITTVGLRSSTVEGSAHSFVVDEFSITAVERFVNQTSAAAQPSGVPLSEIEVALTTSMAVSNGTEFDITLIDVTFSTAVCSHNFELIQVNTTALGSSETMATVTRIQAASEAIRGNVDLSVVRGENVSKITIVHTTTAHEFATLLESIPEIGDVSVTYQAHDSLGCSGGRWEVTYHTLPGDIELLQVESHNLTGTDASLDVEETQTGGLFVYPIPGDMLLSVEREPQVVVTVNGIPAGCALGPIQVQLPAIQLGNSTHCAFHYSPTARPSVFSIVPESGTSGDLLTIHGEGFSSQLNDIEVFLGSTLCVVTSAEESELQCRVTQALAGPQAVRVRVLSKGWSNATAGSNSSISFNYELTVTNISPNIGSLAGGTHVTITGDGFVVYDPTSAADKNNTTENMQILLGNQLCHLVWSNRTTIICTTTANENGTVHITVSINSTRSGEEVQQVSRELSNSYTYSKDSTPFLNTVSPMSGSAGGGTTITLSGQLFPNNTDSVTVMVGGLTCLVLSSTSSEITCITPAHSAGDVAVVVIVRGKGQAVNNIGSPLPYTFALHITNISHVFGSSLGGQRIVLSGEGFGEKMAAVSVKIGPFACRVEGLSNNDVECVTSPSTRKLFVTNNAVNPEYGWGYAWAPANLTIKVGDSVEWTWTGSSFATLRSVMQVSNATSNVYNGHGFRSAATTEGRFSHVFTRPGTFYYVSEGHGHIGFRGSVTVEPLVSEHHNVVVTVNDITASTRQSALEHEETLRANSSQSPCSVEPSPPAVPSSQTLHYTYSVCHTPIIGRVSSSVVHAGEIMSLHGHGLPSKEAGVSLTTLTVNGVPCVAASASSTSRSVPPNSPSIMSDSSIGQTEVLNCTLPFLSSGHYRIVIHVWGRGWGFFADESDKITYEPSATVVTQSGSLQGGTRLRFFGVGFGLGGSAENQVMIGNTPCDVQSVIRTGEIDELVCITRPAVDDGYSAVVGRDQPAAYWTFPAVTVSPSNVIVLENTGWLGPTLNAELPANSIPNQPGLHEGSVLAGKAVRFMGTPISVPYAEQFYSNWSFSTELWLRIPDDASAQLGYYRQIVGSHSAGHNGRGYSLWLNPCGHLEYWLGTGDNVSNTESSSEACPAVELGETLPENVTGIMERCSRLPKVSCSDLRLVGQNASRDTLLPEGVWSVIQTNNTGLETWTHVVLSWELTRDSEGESVCSTSPDLSLCLGNQRLFIDGNLVASTSTNFSRPQAGFKIGSSENEETSHFSGWLDEVAIYGKALSSSQVHQHHHFGSTEDQLLVLTVNGYDRYGTGVTPNVQYPQVVGEGDSIPVNWDSPPSGELQMNSTDRLIFNWTSLQDLVQVSHTSFSACTLLDNPIKRWSPIHRSGLTVVSGLKSGRAYYFISTASASCRGGVKLKVVVGRQHVVQWQLGVTYNNITLSEDAGLLFTWDTTGTTSAVHNVLELASRDAMESCTVSPSDGLVVKNWSHPLTRQGSLLSASAVGNAEVTGLSIGWHYFVCGVGGHCAAGMRLAVQVKSAAQVVSVTDSAESSENERLVIWKVQQYSTMHINEGQSLRFRWEAFHSLHEVTERAFTACDVLSAPLIEWSRAGVSKEIVVTDLSPGHHYFLCSVAGHCAAGMKVEVVVHRLTTLPPLPVPLTAKCCNPSLSECAFQYRAEKTPQIISVTPMTAPVGAMINVTGEGFVTAGQPIGSEIPGLLLTVGTAECSSPKFVAAESNNHTLQCTLGNDEAGLRYLNAWSKTSGSALTQPLSSSPVASLPEDFGFAIPNSVRVVFELQSSVLSLSLSNGSVAGGERVTIFGTGFSRLIDRAHVQFGTVDAEIIGSSISHLECVVPPASIGTVADVNVTVSITINNIASASSLQFRYLASLTPEISGVLPNEAIQQGTTLLITGNRFGSSIEQLSVSLVSQSQLPHGCGQGAACQVTSVNDTHIKCQAPARPTGLYTVVIHAQGRGRAFASPSATQVSYDLMLNNISPAETGHGGGVTITLSGDGFECGSHSPPVASSLSVTVCSRPCAIMSSTYDQIACVLPPSTAAISNGSRSFQDHECNITVSVGDRSVQSSQMFVYRAALTPVIDSVWPRRGGTAGGTLLTIHGSGLVDGGGSATNVSIDGAPCVVWIANDTIIQCRTSAHRTTLTAVVSVDVPIKGKAVEFVPTMVISSTAAEGSGYFQYIDRWSSTYTWGGDPPPREGESVSIRRGQTLLLDTSPPPLNLIVIQGDLIFDDNQDIVLQAKYIFIHGGRLQVGTREQPFCHRALIHLYGNVRDPEIPVYGAKVLALRQGYLELHGKPRWKTWTRLAKTAEQNSTVLHLQEPVDWKAGEKIVLAPTGRDNNETELLTINETSADGYRVNLSAPLQYTHHGLTEDFGEGHTMEIRAEVGLLSRNVIVEGSALEADTPEELGSDQYGVQIMVHRVGFNQTQVRLNHVEVRHAGQAFRLGRYAIHFHLSGNMSGSYVKFCAIHHSFNRAITAHGVHNMLFEGNVAYDIKGHTFFIEDGIETENRYINNLGMVTRGSSSLLNTDQLPATFWITHPNNIFIGNAAAGSRAYGYWYDLDDNSFGPSYSINICPNKEKMGIFEDNVAHSNNEFGFRIWETYTPFENQCNGGKPVVANFYRLTTYANGIHGLELTKVGHIRLIGFKVADNRDNGIEILEAHGDWDGPRVEDTLIASYTSVSTSPPGTGGIKFPNQRWLTVSNVTFANFDSDQQVCIRACSHCKVFQGGFMYFVEKLNFLNQSSQHRVSFKWEHEVQFYDIDGSLGGNVGGWVLPTNGLLPPEHCSTAVPALSMGFSGAACTADVSFVRLSWNAAEPRVTLQDKAVLFSNHHGNTSIPWRHYRLTHTDGYMVTLLPGDEYNMTWQLPDDQQVDVTSFNAGIYNMQENDTILISSHFQTAPDHFRVGSVEVDLGRDPTPSDVHRSWHFDNSTNYLKYLLKAQGSNDKYIDLSYNFFKDPCPVTGCPTPNTDDGPLETRYRRWSNPDDWLTGRVPLGGEDVTILSTWKMILDTSPPPLGQLTIYGSLEFDLADIDLTASNILVFGSRSRLMIGNNTRRYLHRATVTLTGNRNSPTLALSRTMVVGAKAIGVFGELTMFGQQRPVTWTRLAQSALKNTTTLHLTSTQTDWQVGEQLMIAASGYDLHETEVVTITSVDGNGQFSITPPLQYDHIMEPFLLGTESSHGFCPGCSQWNGASMSPEVGLLSRNIRIVGDDSDGSISNDGFGCRILIGQLARGRNLYSGKTYLDGIEIRSCGQGGFHAPRDPRYALVFKGTGTSSTGSFVRNCAFNGNLNTGIGIHLSDGITLEGNVLYRSRGSTILVGGKGNSILNNMAAVTLSVIGNQPLDNHAFDFPATFDVGGVDNQVRGNAAGGSERLSYSYVGNPCTDNMQAPTGNAALFWDNTAHSGIIGLRLFGLTTKCSSVGGFQVTHHWEFGVFGWTASSVILTHLTIGVGRVGICMNNFGPDPVKHFTDDKWVRLEHSLIVGETPTENACRQVRPAGAVAFHGFSESDPKVGVMMSTFSKSRGKMDGTGPWHRPKSYPAINGRVTLTSVTFARFLPNECNMSSYAFTNNPLSPDAMHPFRLQETTLRDVDHQRLVFFHPPDPAWIVQEDCVDMDCDGPKHSIIRDLDGHFLGTSQLGSLIPRAELRFDSSRLPITLLAGGSQAGTSRGIARGIENNVSASTGGCLWMPSWNGYECGNLNHKMLVIENMDPDTEVRRVSPLALLGGDTGGGKYIDLMNGPMDHGWCTYYTCLKRLSTFFSIVVTGTEYELWLTGSNPSHWRFHLLNAQPDEAVKLTIWYKNIQRKDIYKNGIFIEPNNVAAGSQPINDQFIPTVSSAIGGENYFDAQKQLLHLVVKGSSPIDVTTAPVVTVAFSVVSLDDFFDPQQFVFNLAFVLGIPPTTIRLVNVIEEDSGTPPESRRRRRRNTPQTHMLVVQIGDPPKENQTVPAAPPVSEQIAEGAPDSSTDNIDGDANNTATDPPETNPASQPVSLPAGANLTDSPTQADVQAAFQSRREQYMSQVEEYRTAVNVTNRINQIAADLVQRVLTNSLNTTNAQVSGMSVDLAAAPPAPTPTVLLPPSAVVQTSNGSNTTTTAFEPIVAEPLPQVLLTPSTTTTNASGNTSTSTGITFSIPSDLHVVREPPVETGHLLYVEVEVVDVLGQRVRSLGLGETWKCLASLVTSDSAELEGQVEVDFVDGLAAFTRLRVDRTGENFRLRFSSSRASLTTESNVAFNVHGPSTETARSRARFQLSDNFTSVIGQERLGNFTTALRQFVAGQLDVDQSRITDINVFSNGTLVSFSILEAANTAPPDVPTLAQARMRLESLSSNMSLQICVGADCVALTAPSTGIFSCGGANGTVCGGHGVCGSNGLCACSPYFTGETCENDVDECSPQSVCLNGGSCQNMYGSFLCTCPNGYDGHVCQNVIPTCGGVVCFEGSVCNQMSGMCECIGGLRYSAGTCQKPTLPCHRENSNVTFTISSDAGVLDNFIGCYSDNPDDRDLPVQKVIGCKSRTPCLHVCRINGYPFAALQSGSWCYCGCSFGRTGSLVGSMECNATCVDSGEQFCGGDQRNAVYSTGFYVG